MDRDFLLTTKDVADILKVKVTTIYRMIKNQTLPQPLKMGKAFRWNRQDFLDNLNSVFSN